LKKFTLIRHAKSSWSDASLKDFDRPLNDRGIRDAPRMAAKLLEMLGEVDLIVSSPANRAISTALVFAKAFGIKSEDIHLKDELYHAYPEEVMKVLHAIDDKHKSVFIFGHNPTFTTIADTFSKDYIDNVPTCGASIIASSADEWASINESNAKLVNFIYPKML